MDEDIKLKRVTIKFSEREKLALKIAAAKAGKTITDFCREIIEEEVAKAEQK